MLLTLRPPPGASTRTIRRAGAVTAAIGIAFLAVGILMVVLAGPSDLTIKLFAPLALAGLSAIVVGGFRLLLATEPDQMSSTKRMTLGVLFGCGGLVLVLVLVLAVAALVMNVKR